MNITKLIELITILFCIIGVILSIYTLNSPATMGWIVSTVFAISSFTWKKIADEQYKFLIDLLKKLREIIVLRK